MHSIDLLKPISLEATIKEYDVVINCVGQISTPISQCLSLNTDGITKIINSVKKYNKRLIHISTVSVYGSANYVDEDSDLNPETPYGSMKCFAEYLIKSNLDNYTILRVSNLYGNGQKKGIINYLVDSYLANRNEIYFNNDGSMKRYYLHIDELVYMINEVCMEHITGIYNITGKDQLTIKELVTMFESILCYKFDTTYTNHAPIENLEEINCDKVKEIINFSGNDDLKSYIESLKS